MLRCWKLADYGTLPLYQVGTPLLTEKVGRLPALTSLDVVVLQCRAATHSLGAVAWAELDGVMALVLRGECNFVQKCATVNVRLQLMCWWVTVSFDTSKYGVVYYWIERVFHVVHLTLLLLVDTAAAATAIYLRVTLS